MPLLTNQSFIEPEKVNLFEGERDLVVQSPDIVNTPQKNANKKKLRGDDGDLGNGNHGNKNDTGSAAPCEGDCWEQ